MKQEADKSAAVATVVAAVDMARVREPVISAVEQTVQRTTTTATHVPPAPEQVRGRPSRLSFAGRGPTRTPCSNRSEGTFLAKGSLRYQRCAKCKCRKYWVCDRHGGRQELWSERQHRRSDKVF